MNELIECMNDHDNVQKRSENFKILNSDSGTDDNSCLWDVMLCPLAQSY